VGHVQSLRAVTWIKYRGFLPPYLLRAAVMYDYQQDHTAVIDYCSWLHAAREPVQAYCLHHPMLHACHRQVWSMFGRCCIYNDVVSPTILWGIPIPSAVQILHSLPESLMSLQAGKRANTVEVVLINLFILHSSHAKRYVPKVSALKCFVSSESNIAHLGMRHDH
jgi:hypothetical protein